MTQKNITDQLRERYTADLMNFLSEKYLTDVCRVSAGTIMIPAVDENGDDRWVKFSVIIPKDAAEENGNDGYTLANDYSMKQKEKAERRRKAEEAAAARKNSKQKI